jgi:hypothetical protein
MPSHRGHTGGAYRSLRAWVLATYWDCLRCGLPVDKDLPGTDPSGPSLDLVLPWSKGGRLTRDNSALSHLGCNARYRDGTPVRSVTTSRVRTRGLYAPSRNW